MSVLIVTSLGDIVIDLHTDRCPLTSKNFLKLCKIKYYNGCLFHTIQKDFTAQTGDPTGTGTGGDSIYKFLYGEQARFFSDEIHLDLKHAKTGTVAMASAGENLNASQFYFTLRDDLDYLDGKHTVFGEVAEGIETLTRINEAYLDEKGRPYKNIRIKHTYILDDPFDDPSQLTELIPDASPEGKPKDEVDDEVRLEDDWVPMDEQLDPAKLEEVIREKQAHSSAVVLESIGDIPEAEIKPPDNVLFVCKLNPVTEDEDLHTIFSRFGTVTSADIIRDYKTGDSLCYAFIEFEDKDACEQAYFKMDNALIDDRRIHVDFSQSVARLWSQFRRKDHQTGKGCFKCGAFDHIAKDCTGATDKLPAPKYILKDGSGQHGADNSRYEMIFDEDNASSPERGRKHGDHESDEQIDKHKVRRRSSEDPRHIDHHRKDSSEHPRYDDRKREFKYSGQAREREARRGRDGDDDYRRQTRVGEKYIEGKDKDRSPEQEHRKRAGPGSDQRGGKDEGDHKRRSSEDDKRRGDRVKGDGDYKSRRSGDGRRDDRGHRRLGTDDMDEPRKKHSDDGTRNREGREHRRGSTETGNQGDRRHDRDRDRDRRHREDRRR